MKGRRGSTGRDGSQRVSQKAKDDHNLHSIIPSCCILFFPLAILSSCLTVAIVDYLSQLERSGDLCDE